MIFKNYNLEILDKKNNLLKIDDNLNTKFF